MSFRGVCARACMRLQEIQDYDYIIIIFEVLMYTFS